MKKLEVFSPNAEVLGAAVNSIVNSILHEQFDSVLGRYGLTEVGNETWYSQQLVIDVLGAIVENVHDSLVMVSVGTKVIENALMPPILDIEEAVQALAQVYQMNHRNLHPEERVIVQRVGDRHMEAINATPYPDDLMYGYFYGVVTRFRPPNSRPVIAYRTPVSVNGDGNMVYDITW